MEKPLPRISLHNRQRRLRPRLPWLRRLIQSALPACIAAAKVPGAPLLECEEIEISLIHDAEMARVHGEFLDDPTPTDVITFHHGEILLSTETALRQGLEHGLSLDQELGLYAIHGMLHLGGWEDHEPEEAAAMAAIQEGILQECLRQMPA